MNRSKPSPKMQPIVLSEPVPEVLETWALQAYPYEACGLLLGRSDSTAIQALWGTRAENLDRRRPHDRFTLDPVGFLTADRQARDLGLEIVGIWHTHPDHPAEPSRTDLEAAWEGYSYLILSTSESGVGALRSWRIFEERFHEQDILREDVPL